MAVLRMMAVKVMHGDKVECLILSCFGVLIMNRQTKERRNEGTKKRMNKQLQQSNICGNSKRHRSLCRNLNFDFPQDKTSLSYFIS